MNANELADELAFKHIAGDDSGAFSSKIITMLRQQQAEIEALKTGKIRAYDNGVEDGRKPNTHPVKELNRELLDKTIIDQQNEIKDLRKNLDVALMIVNKPELTDEEIKETIKPIIFNQYMTAYKYGFEVAKAILRKAQNG